MDDGEGPAAEARRRGGPRLTGRAAAEREARARRVAEEMRANLLKRKRRQRALRERQEEPG